VPPQELFLMMQRLKKNGRKLLGCFPLYPPVELFHSMNLDPIILWGFKPFFSGTPKSDQHLQSFVCSVGRHLTEFVLSEAGALLDGLFMYNACDTLRNLPEILRCGMEEEGGQAPILNIHIPMVSPGQTNAGPYLKNEIISLVERLEKTFDVSFSGSKFEESVETYRRNRNLAQKLEQGVARGKLAFGEFVNLMQGNCLRSVEEQIDALESTLAGIEKVPQAPSCDSPEGNVFLSGILPPPARVTSVIEEVGLRVVGNDIASLARSYYYTPETAAPPADYYVDFYSNHHACTTLLGSADRRLDELENRIDKSNARGIIFLGEKFCEYEYFEFPYLENRFKQKGLHTLMLEFATDDQGVDAYRTRIEAFAELMARRDK